MTVIQWLLDNYQTIIGAAALIMSGASVIAGLTPTPKDDAVISKIISFLSFLKSKDAQGTFKVPFK